VRLEAIRATRTPSGIVPLARGPSRPSGPRMKRSRDPRAGHIIAVNVLVLLFLAFEFFFFVVFVQAIFLFLFLFVLWRIDHRLSFVKLPPSMLIEPVYRRAQRYSAVEGASGFDD
jgi:hypothetical protein